MPWRGTRGRTVRVVVISFALLVFVVDAVVVWGAFAAVVAGVAALALGAAAVRARSDRRRADLLVGAEATAGRRLNALLNDSPDMFLVVRPGGALDYRSETSKLLLGPMAARIDDLIRLARPDEQERLRRHIDSPGSRNVSAIFELAESAGRPRQIDVRVSDLTGDEAVGGTVVTIRDVSEQQRLRESLHRQAMTDPLTGLPNRRVLKATLEEQERSGGSTSLLLIDIDGFKAINDGLGHNAGDELLQFIARRLRTAGRLGETVVRLGGDEFAVILLGATAVDAGRRAAQIAELLARPFRLEAATESVHFSIGTATAATSSTIDQLILRADTAMYAAKRRGGATVVEWHRGLDEDFTPAARIRRALSGADFGREFSLVYQPIVRTADTSIAGVETLLRWNSPELGSVRPDEFIAVAERSGDIIAIGQWVLDEVCRQLAAWIAAGIDPDITVSFNVSPHQLADDEFVSSVITAAETWSIPPGRLTIEITETAALDRAGVAASRLAELHDAGFGISIDDFGDGYANFGQLLQVPLDVLKVDRSLLLTLASMEAQHAGDRAGPFEIMKAIVSIAAAVDARVVCEGVETEEHLRSLIRAGVAYVQGSLTGRPEGADIIGPALLARSARVGGSQT